MIQSATEPEKERSHQTKSESLRTPSNQEITRAFQSGIIEIQPSPTPISLEELKFRTANAEPCPGNIPSVSCKALLAPDSTLVLHRTSDTSPNFCSSLVIRNSTSFLHGFKACSMSESNFRIKPDIGLIPPRSQVEVQVKSKPWGKSDNLPTPQGGILIKTFRSYCDQTSKLPDYFEKLTIQHPELIQTQSVDKIAMWSFGKLVGVTDKWDGVQNIDSLGEDARCLHWGQYRTEPKYSAKDLAKSVTQNAIIVKESLRSVNKAISDFKVYNTWFLGVSAIMLMISFFITISTDRDSTLFKKF